MSALNTADNDAIAKLSFVGDFDNIGLASPSVAYVKCVQNLLDLSETGNPDYYDPCDNTDNWNTGDAAWISVNGKLEHALTSSQVYAHYKDVTVRDGIVSAKIQFEGNSGCWGGLAVRRGDGGSVTGSSGYFAFIQGRALRFYKGGSGYLGPMMTLDAGLDMSAGVELTIVMRGERFDIHVNGEFKFTVYDNAYSSGYAGPVAMNAKISCDDFKIHVYDDPCGDINKWVCPAGNNWSVTADKRLIHDANTPSMLHAHLINTENMANGSVSARIRFEGDGYQPGKASDYWCGLSVRRDCAQGFGQSGYIVFLRPKGTNSILQICKCSVGGVSVKKSKEINVNVSYETELRIEMQNNSFRVYVNGTLYDEYTDTDPDTYQSGSVGPIAFNARVSCKDFKIKRL